MARKQVAVLISGRGSNLASLIAATKNKNYPAEIALVVSNVPKAKGLLIAQGANIPTVVIDHKEFQENRPAFERRLQDTLEMYGIDIVCLAGFMRLLTAGFVSRWAGRMLNIHPSLLPAFKGLHTHRRALEAGAKQHGATVHFVAPEVDSGPIVSQEAIEVRRGDTEDSLAERVLVVEHRIYPRALGLLAAGRISLANPGWTAADKGK